MILTIEEYKEKIRTLQKQLTDDMTIQLKGHIVGDNGENIPNFYVVKREEKNRFVIESKAVLSVRILKNDKIMLDLYPSKVRQDLYPSEIDSDDLFPHVESILEQDKKSILDVVNGYVE